MSLSTIVYKKTVKGHHFIPRTGSYSTHPHRNGRVDVLPPDAVESLWDVADQIAGLEERLETLHQHKRELQLATHHAARLTQMQAKVTGGAMQTNPREVELRRDCEATERQIFLTRYNLNELKHALNPRDRKLTSDAAFVVVARLVLDHDVFQSIEQKAERLIARTGRKVRKV